MHRKYCSKLCAMKKSSIILVALLALTIGSVKAQWFDFSQNMSDVTIGVNVGVVGYHFNGQIDKTFSGLGVGASVSLVGVYMDFIYRSPEHKWDKTVTLAEYPDQTALTINMGYKIPVTSWLNLIPLVGYSNETSGRTIGNSINVDTENHSIYHDYVRDEIYNHFNYGVGLSVKPINWLEIGGVCTAHAVYGNLSFNLMKMKK